MGNCNGWAMGTAVFSQRKLIINLTGTFQKKLNSTVIFEIEMWFMEAGLARLPSE